MSLRHRSQVWVAFAIAGAFADGVAPMAAQAQTVTTARFHIPAEAIDEAIADFARQSGLQIVAPTTQLHGVVAQPLDGEFAPREALRHLLVNTGLEVSSEDGSLIVLRVAARASPATAATRRSVGRSDTTGAAAAVVERDALAQVLVTAEKQTAVPALGVPVSLATYDRDTLAVGQVITLFDLQNIDPAISFNRGGLGVVISLRGVTSADLTSKGTPDIAFNMDGVPLNRGFELAETLFDLERVELLKGPQGTLYGASSTGGALNVVTAKPSGQFAASADVTAGNYGTRRTTDVLNVPLSDALAVRASINYNYHDGYDVLRGGQPYTNGEDDFAARLSAAIAMSDDMDLQLQETFGNIGGSGSGPVNYDTLLNQPKGSAQRTVYYDPYGQRLDDSFHNLTAQFNWSFGRVHLAYVGGYMLYSADENTSSTNNPLANDAPNYDRPAYDVHRYRGHFQTDAHELRLTNQNPARIDWLIGGNWVRESIHEDDHYWSGAAAGAGSLPGVSDLVNGGDAVNSTVHTASGLFGQATWHTNAALDLTFGLRETWDDLSRRGTFATGPVAGCVAPAPCDGGPNVGSERDDKLTYRVNAAYHVTATQMLFATVASGFKSGGFNDFCAVGPCPYQPEELVSYELGYKGRPRQNLEFNSDIFYYDFAAMQIPGATHIAGGNVPSTGTYSAVIEGWENELVYRLTAADSLHLNVINLRSYYDDVGTFLPADVSGVAAPYNLRGHTLSAVPTTAATLSYQHDFSLVNGAKLRLHAQLKYSSAYDEIQIAPFYSDTQPAFTRSNIDVRYISADGKFYVGGYMTNIENELQITAPSASGDIRYPSGLTGADDVAVSDPRTWGFTAGLRWSHRVQQHRTMRSPLKEQPMSARYFAIALLVIACGANAQTGTSPVVSVTGGKVQGKLMPDGSAVFKGVPFAQPPVGALRWREPQPVKSWTGVRQAADFAATCAQGDSGWNKLAASRGSEDCLYLNVWAPEWPSKSKKAVMIWIHGGGNGGGSALGSGGIEPSFDGSSLSQRGVVVVTIQYRLGLFGFIGHPELTAESPHHASGAYGLLDQIAAITWVRDNIARFGGDPQNLTVFGQSAGAQDLSILLTSPLARGLFQKAILESGSPMISDKRLQTPAQMEQLGVILAHALQAPASGAINYLRGLSTADILAATPAVGQELRAQGLILDVGMDGYVVPEFSPAVYRAGKEAPVTAIIGNNGREAGGGGRGNSDVAPEQMLKDQIARGYPKYPDLQAQLLQLYGLDGGAAQTSTYPPYGSALAQFGTDEAFRCQAVALAHWHSAVAPTYEYEFTAFTDEHPPLHSGELSFVFGYLPDWAGAQNFQQLSGQMQAYWTNFAKTGDPNGAGLPQWPRHDAAGGRYLELSNNGPIAKSDLRPAQCTVYGQKLNRDIDARQAR